MGRIDWLVVAASCVLVFIVGLWFSRRSSKRGAEGYFTGNRDVPWWAIGLSNTATYQSGNGAFVMIALVFGLAGNWIWWASWIVWMPLVAIIWARLWRRMQIVTTAELISLRYGGTPAVVARKVYAFVCCFGFAVLIISYITGFFAQTIAPLCPLTTTRILLIFGGTTVLYTMFGGLLGVVYSDVAQFAIMVVGSTLFFVLAVPQHGGWEQILHRISTVRPEGLTQVPPTRAIDGLTVLILVLQGWFFAGSPTAGEGMTAQRFMSARNERHAIGGQLFNSFLALSFRTLPLIGLGIIAMSLLWTSAPDARLGAVPAGMSMIDNPAHAWGELIKRCRLPLGFTGLLVAAEAAAYMSTLSSLINWGGSFVVNDLLPSQHSPRRQVWISRITTLLLFVFAAVITILYVNDMVSWFKFINNAMVIFFLPLACFRFFWWRFNVWGELAAILLGLPLEILIWFVLGFDAKPMWQGLGMLFLLSFVVLTAVTLLTPPESPETLKRFYERCRPPGFWGPVRGSARAGVADEPSAGRLMFDSLLGIIACLGLVLATNAMFVKDWFVLSAGAIMSVGLGAWLLRRVLEQPVRRRPSVTDALVMEEE
jgi:solute:Na+ symporter, SSS family